MPGSLFLETYALLLRHAFLLALTGLFACGDDSTMPDASADQEMVDRGVDGSDAGSDAAMNVPFTAMTWNVQNFFDSQNDPDRSDEFVTPAELRDKIEDLSRVIRAQNPDFLALQEVENEQLLARLIQDGLEGMGYTEFGLMDGFDGRGIDVGYISRVPVTNVVSHIGERFEGPAGEQRFTRDALEVFLDVQGTEVIVMTSHFLSQRQASNEARRIGEAQQAQDLLRRRLLTRDRVLFVGDINDTPDSPTYDAMVLDGVLIDLTLSILARDRWTFIFNGRDQLDYAFGSSVMTSELLGAEIPRGADIEQASDHYPVIARFSINRQ